MLLYLLLLLLYLYAFMKFLKIRYTKIDNFVKSKKVLKSTSSLIYSYLFLIWYLIKPSIIISENYGNLLYKIILYLYEILPLSSYLILIINTGIQLKIGKMKTLKKVVLLFFYILNILTLPILLKYAFLILF